MLRTKLLTAAAATALLAAPAAFAQDTTTQQMPPAEQTAPTPQPAPVPAPAPAPQAAPAPAPAPAAPAVQANNVIDVLAAQGNFTTLLAALDSAGLTDTLKSRPAISIFAPTDEAFAALPEAERTRLMDPANAAELRSLLLYHVIVADVQASQIQGARGGVETAGRVQVLLDGTGESLKIDGATITQADIDASNGAVFAIDKVLNPAQSMAAMGDEETAAAPAALAAPAAPAATDEAPAAASVPPLPATEPPSPVAPPSPATATPPVPNATGITETTRPASPGATAPNGQPSAVTTTVQSPPVQNPTDGQVDDEEDEANPAPTPGQPAAPTPRPAPTPTPN